jgi:Cys-rich protein (TIGR01571 family)
MQMAPQHTNMNKVWLGTMNSGLCGCCSDCSTCLFAWCFPLCLSGSNQAEIGNSCLTGCLCYICCAGCYRSNVQQALGAPDSGCFLNCLYVSSSDFS